MKISWYGDTEPVGASVGDNWLQSNHWVWYDLTEDGWVAHQWEEAKEDAPVSSEQPTSESKDEAPKLVKPRGAKSKRDSG